MYLFILFIIIAICIYTYIFKESDNEYDSINERIAKTAMVGSLVSMLVAIIFLFVSGGVLCNSEKKLESREKYNLISIDGKTVTFTEKGMNVIYTKNGVVVSLIVTGLKESEDATDNAYVQVSNYVQSNKWAWGELHPVETEVYLPASMMSLTKQSTRAER